MEYGEEINILISQIVHETNGDFHVIPVTGDDVWWHCDSYLQMPYEEIGTDHKDLLTCLKNHKAKTDLGMVLRMGDND